MKKFALLLIGMLFMTSCQKEVKTAFVQTETIFKEYKGIKAQEKIIKKKQESLNSKFQNLAQQFQKEVSDFQSNISKMSPKKVREIDAQLGQKQQQIQLLQQQEWNKLNEEVQKQQDSIVKEMYKFFEDYGKKNGYTYIYGKNDGSGTLMYGGKQYDITNVVLKAMDSVYDVKNNLKTEEKTPETPKKETEEKK